MNPTLLQKQLKDNSADLDDFYKELKSWGEDMKKKEELHQKSNDNDTHHTEKRTKATLNENNNQSKTIKSSQCKKVKSKEKFTTKIGGTDYDAWDKFDADAECEKVDYDEHEESELTDECDENLRDLAYLEKEKGNKFVKSEKWDEAIECYTKALDFYGYDPIFYANRALCFLKKENMAKAEADCTMSLKLDKTYVKAYLRRAAAREALNKLDEAETDLLKVLEIEPKNKEAIQLLENLRNTLTSKQKVLETTQRPISKFTASRQHKRSMTQQNMINTLNNRNQESAIQMNSQNNVNYWPSGNDNIILVKAVAKPPHLQSKKTLKRVDIEEISGFEKVLDANETSRAASYPKENKVAKTLKTDDLKIVELSRDMVPDSQQMLKNTKNEANSNKIKESEYYCPKNSVQFYAQWKYLKTWDEKYAFIKLIEPEKLPEIFKESLDTNIFSEILKIFVTCFIKHNDQIFKYLLFLSKMKRFSTFTMFMTSTDKSYLRQLFNHIMEHEAQFKHDVDELYNKYEL